MYKNTCIRFRTLVCKSKLISYDAIVQGPTMMVPKNPIVHYPQAYGSHNRTP